LGVESADSRWSLIGSVKNLTDKRYNEEWVLGGFAALAAPRTWVVEASYRF
jgi:iron complex outermembrane receptor protein